MKPFHFRSTLHSALAPLLATSLLACEPRAEAAPPPKDAKDATGTLEKSDSKGDKSPDPVLPHHFVQEASVTTGSLTERGQRISYHATAGTLVVHAKGWDDVSQRLDTEPDKPKGIRLIATTETAD